MKVRLGLSIDKKSREASKKQEEKEAARVS